MQGCTATSRSKATRSALPSPAAHPRARSRFQIRSTQPRTLLREVGAGGGGLRCAAEVLKKGGWGWAAGWMSRDRAVGAEFGVIISTRRGSSVQCGAEARVPPASLPQLSRSPALAESETLTQQREREKKSAEEEGHPRSLSLSHSLAHHVTAERSSNAARAREGGSSSSEGWRERKRWSPRARKRRRMPESEAEGSRPALEAGST